jgi:hypothetical protein
MPMTAAVAALVISALPKRLRIALTPFPCRSRCQALPWSRLARSP